METVAAVCFIACHGGPAGHFAAFAEELPKKGIHVEVYAAGAALTKLKGEKVSAFSIEDVAEEDLKAQEIAQEILKKAPLYKSLVVITDVGHSFAIKMQEALGKLNLSHFVY